MPKKYGEVRRILRDAGWTPVRQAGSHETWKSADGKRSVIVSGRAAKMVPVGTLASMRRSTGLDGLR
ncbi:MAG: type II toxin-antitoxin system HicA family toxin [Thermoleophilaceae bacterium]|nr:type II toxin-antitoxin system HicA family toxin [Thermoleophilaceae bacterium]